MDLKQTGGNRCQAEQDAVSNPGAAPQRAGRRAAPTRPAAAAGRRGAAAIAIVVTTTSRRGRHLSLSFPARSFVRSVPLSRARALYIPSGLVGSHSFHGIERGGPL